MIHDIKSRRMSENKTSFQILVSHFNKYVVLHWTWYNIPFSVNHWNSKPVNIINIWYYS